MPSFSALGPRLALAAASILFTLVAAEGALRVAGYAPERFQHTNRIANRGRTVLLDCYPSDPNAELDVDLADPATRKRYEAEGGEVA